MLPILPCLTHSIRKELCFFSTSDSSIGLVDIVEDERNLRCMVGCIWNYIIGYKRFRENYVSLFLLTPFWFAKIPQ